MLNQYRFGKNLEIQDEKNNILNKTEKNNKNYYKYTMMIENKNEKCPSFLWKSSSKNIIFKSSVPISYQKLNDNTIEIFPCDYKNKHVVIQWYQEKNDENKNENLIGGEFIFQKKIKELPKFYFGKYHFDMNKSVFVMEKDLNQKLDRIFFVENDDIPNVLQSSSKIVQTTRNFFPDSKNTSIFFMITKL